MHHLKKSVNVFVLDGGIHTFAAEIQSEEEGSTGRCDGIKASSDVVDPASSKQITGVRCHTKEKERCSVEDEWNRQDVYRLQSPVDEPPKKRRDEVYNRNDI